MLLKHYFTDFKHVISSDFEQVHWGLKYLIDYIILNSIINLTLNLSLLTHF